MTPSLSVALDDGPLERVAVELAVAGFFETERPLRGEAGRADWRLCGLLSELVRSERLRGAAGEAALLPTGGRLRAPRLLVLGLGRSAGFGATEVRLLARAAVQRALRLGVASLALPFPGHWLGLLAAGPAAAALLRGAVAALEELGGALLLRVVVPEGAASRALAGLESAVRPLADGPVSIRLIGPEPITSLGARAIALAARSEGGSLQQPQRY